MANTVIGRRSQRIFTEYEKFVCYEFKDRSCYHPKNIGYEIMHTQVFCKSPQDRKIHYKVDGCRDEVIFHESLQIVPHRMLNPLPPGSKIVPGEIMNDGKLNGAGTCRHDRQVQLPLQYQENTHVDYGTAEGNELEFYDSFYIHTRRDIGVV